MTIHMMGSGLGRVAPRLLTVVVTLLVWVLFAGAATADSRTEFLIGRLRAEDFRVRTNAALALGATNDESAIQPLCGALSDSSDVVRQAVAVAMKRLGKPSALGCLRSRLGSESAASVRLQMTRAIESLEAARGGGGGGGGEVSTDVPKVVPNARVYVSLSQVMNSTTRPQGEIQRIVQGAIRAKLDSLGGFQIAPDKESSEAARAVISKRKLKGYYLAIAVDKFDYEGGNLRVKVKVAVFTYPGKDLRGEVPAGLTQTGVRPGDKGSEDQLLEIAGGRAAELFAQNFQ